MRVNFCWGSLCFNEYYLCLRQCVWGPHVCITLLLFCNSICVGYCLWGSFECDTLFFGDPRCVVHFFGSPRHGAVFVGMM